MLTNNQHFVPTSPHLYLTDSLVSREKFDLNEIHVTVNTQFSDFFDSFTPAEFSDKLSVILHSYSADDYYRESSPSDVLFVMEKLSDLVAGAHYLYLHHFPHSRSGANHNSLNESEIPAESHQEIAKFFGHQQIQEWQQTIKHITFFALCKDSPADAGYTEDTLFLFNAFTKLVAACYQILKLVDIPDKQ